MNVCVCSINTRKSIIVSVLLAFFYICEPDEDQITFYDQIKSKTRSFQRVHCTLLGTVFVFTILRAVEAVQN